jgi:hypothetical protein
MAQHMVQMLEVRRREIGLLSAEERNRLEDEARPRCAEIERLEQRREICEQSRQAHELIARVREPAAAAGAALASTEAEYAAAEPDRKRHGQLMVAATLRPLHEQHERTL